MASKAQTCSRGTERVRIPAPSSEEVQCELPRTNFETKSAQTATAQRRLMAA